MPRPLRHGQQGGALPLRKRLTSVRQGKEGASRAGRNATCAVVQLVILLFNCLLTERVLLDSRSFLGSPLCPGIPLPRCGARAPAAEWVPISVAPLNQCLHRAEDAPTTRASPCNTQFQAMQLPVRAEHSAISWLPKGEGNHALIITRQNRSSAVHAPCKYLLLKSNLLRAFTFCE